MSLEEMATKVIPPLVVTLVITLAGVVITVYIMESRVTRIESVNKKQWEFISKTNNATIRNEERITCVQKGCK